MGLMSKILGGNQSRTVEDYAELDLEDASMGSAEATMQVHIAEVGTKADAIDIKDAVYDGDIVIADITRLRTEDSTVEHIVDELRQVAQEVDGDIVRKGEDQMIITPTGIHISREKLGQKLCRVGYWTTSHVLFSALRLLSSRTHSFAFSAVAIAQLPRW